MVSKLEWSMVEGAIAKCQQDYKLDTRAKAFSYFVLEQTFPNTEESIEDFITEGGNDCGIDAIKITRLPGLTDIHFFQFKYRATYENASKYFPGDSVDKAIAFFKCLFDEDKKLEQSCNSYLWEKIQEIWESIGEASTRFTLHFCTNGQNLESSQKTRLAIGLAEYRVTFKEVNDKALSDAMINAHRKETLHYLTAVDKQIFERTDGDIRGLVVTVNAQELVQVISGPDHQDKVDEAIFDQNIRIYLGADNAVNEAIIRSALSEDNNYFWYLNNGITAICSGYAYQPGARSPKIEIKNLQIVNGAQTSFALSEARRLNPKSLDDILILVRLYETQNKEMPYNIAVATNSQSRIGGRDLTSNSKVQMQLEKAFAGLGYFYERKKNQYKDQSESLRIDAFKLGQAILAFHLREPERAKTASDQIFGHRFDEVFDVKHDANYLLNIYKVFADVEALRSDTNQIIKKGSVIEADTFLAYGQFHIIYLVSILAAKSGLDFSISRNRQRLIKDALSFVRNYVSGRKTHSFYNLFRNPKTKQDLYDLVFARGQLELELVSNQRKAS